VESPWNDPDNLAWERARLTAARRGDRAAFAELYGRFAPELFRRVLMPRLGNRQAAEDALSEVFRTFLERMDRYEDQGKSVWYWLARVAVNKATDMHRVKGRTNRALVSFKSLLDPLAEGPSDPDAEVSGKVEKERLGDAVKETMERLNPRYRRAIELRFLEDRSRQDCAEALEVKLGTFDVLILRALRSFRKEWERSIGATPETL
jgi:RNA polymerase sigma-70 factor (ECF subfamily)